MKKTIIFGLLLLPIFSCHHLGHGFLDVGPLLTLS